MSEDLVKRLRSPEVFLMTSGMISPVAEAAADRIEKLTAALRDVMEMAEVHEIPFRDRMMYISDIARKA